MKYLMFFIFVTLFNICGISQNQNEFIYSTTGEKIYFQFRKDLVFVKSKPTKGALLKPMLSPLYDIKNDFGESFVIQIRDQDSFKLVPSFLGKILYYNNILESENGTLHSPSNEVFIWSKGRKPTDIFSLAGLKNEIISETLINEYSNIYLVKIDGGNTIDICRFLNENKLCEYAKPCFYIITSPFSSNNYYDQQWALNNTGQFGGTPNADIKIQEAWNITKGNPNIKVAVIDEGIDLNHLDLIDNLLPGYDATDGALGGNNGGYKGNDAHGTACAGIIAAMDNNEGIVGIAPKCKIIPIRMAYSDDNGHWITNENWIVKAIKYAWETAGADVLSNSWEIIPSGAITAEIANAIVYGRGGKGCVVVAASGNRNLSNVEYPAELNVVIAVGATSYCDERKSLSSCDGIQSWGSNYGHFLNVVAPGVKIYTTDISGNGGYNTQGDYTSFFGGTSAACPHVAGLAALVLSVDPSLNWSNVQQIIELSCDKVGGNFGASVAHPNGTWNSSTGYGRINAYRSVSFALSHYSGSEYSGYDGPSEQYGFSLINKVGNFGSGLYFAERYGMYRTIKFNFTPNPIIYGICNGLSLANPNAGASWFQISNLSSTEATIKTYLYDVYKVNGQYCGWLPCYVDDFVINYYVINDITKSIYLQNRNEGNRKIYQTMLSISAGYNINQTIPNGNYTIKTGSDISFFAKEYILLDDGFEVEAGAVFQAEQY